MLHGFGHGAAVATKAATALLAVAATGFGWAVDQVLAQTGTVDQLVPWAGLGAGVGFFAVAAGVFRFSIKILRAQIDDLQTDARELRHDLNRVRLERNEAVASAERAAAECARVRGERDLTRAEVTSLKTRLELIDPNPPDPPRRPS